MSTGRSVCFGEASTRWAGDRCAVGNQSQVRGRKGCNRRVRVWRGEKVGHSTVGQWNGWLCSELLRCHFPATFIGYIGHTCRIRTTVKYSTPQPMDSAPTTSSASRTATSPPHHTTGLHAFLLSSSLLSSRCLLEENNSCKYFNNSFRFQ